MLLGLPALLLVGCGFQGAVPPTLTSITPATVAAGSPGFTLTATGTFFSTGTRIVWDGVPQATTVVSATQMTTSVTAAQVFNPGTITIGVLKADSTTSNELQLTVTGQGAAAETLLSISPSSVAAGSADFTLTATGSNFSSGSVIALNGVGIVTTYDSATQLHATIPATQIATAGTINVGVLDPTNVLSNELPLTVTAQGVAAEKLLSISPSSVAAGSVAFTLTATGSNFSSGSVIALNGAGITSTYDSATQLHATVAATQVTTPGTINVGVLGPTNVLSNELPLTVTGTAPTTPPTLTSVNPASVIAGSAAFTLTATGTGFLTGSQITWNGVPLLATTFVSATSLQANVPAPDVTTPSTVTVAVLNPGSTVSNVLPFTVAVPPTVVPTLTSLNPSRMPVGSPAFTMTVTGSSFAPGAVVQWNGQALPTTVVSMTQLTAQVPASDLLSVGQVPVTAINPSSAASNPLPFYVGGAVFFDEVNDLAWDPQRNVIYISEPGSASKNPNSVLAIDPGTLVVKHTFAAATGSEPDRMAISADGKYLYVGLDGAGTVERLLLPALTADISIPLGSDPALGKYFALDLQVAPGASQTIAVSRGIPAGKSIVQAQGGVAVYDDAVQRPLIVTPTTQAGTVLLDTIQWGSDATALYAANTENANGDFYQLAVSAAGVALVSDHPGYFPAPNTRIHFDSGDKLLYGDDGLVVNPVAGTQSGNFVSTGSMVPDSTIGDAYFLGQPSSQNGTVGYLLQSFNLATQAPIATLPLYNVQGAPGHLIRYGSNGLAFNTTKITSCVASPCDTGSGRLYLFNGPFVTQTAP